MPIKNIPKALIVPHAGYVYSGATAAAAFATLRNGAQTITRVVLIGRWIRVPWTPLPAYRLSFEDDAAHAPEHALEVELPFLQTLLASFEWFRYWSVT